MTSTDMGEAYAASTNFLNVLQSSRRDMSRIAGRLDNLALALETVGLTKLAEDLSMIGADIEDIAAGLDRAYSGKLSAEVGESQRMMGSILSAALNASKNPRKVRDATIVGGVVVAEGENITPAEWPGRYGRDRNLPADQES